MNTTSRCALALLVVAVVAVAFVACGDDDAGGSELNGLIELTAGECGDAGVTTGSWFRMVQSGGSVDDGPYVENTDSPCGDPTWTPLSPGTDGGVVLGEHQPEPEPPFDAEMHSRASAIIEPQTFFAVRFGVATNSEDPQTRVDVAAPTLEADGESVSGDLSAWAVSWNGQHFNQGAPKPGGGGAGPTGTYDSGSGALRVEWTSLIEGGPFDGFTGVWHLEGTLDTP